MVKRKILDVSLIGNLPYRLFLCYRFFPFWCNNFGWPKTKNQLPNYFCYIQKRMTKINRQIKCIILKCPFYIDFKTNRQYVAIWFCNLYTLLVWLTRIILFFNAPIVVLTSSKLKLPMLFILLDK